MATFPGIVLIIDDKFDLIYGEKPTGPDRVEYNNFSKIKAYCNENGLPLLAITDTSSLHSIEEKLNKMNNVRLLLLDLDLDGDGQVTHADGTMVIGILRAAVKKFGYFFLLINSITPDQWQDIKENIPQEDADVILLVNNLEENINKNENISQTLDSIINRNHSVKLIYLFETALNESRDKALKEFIDYDKDTWKSWITLLERESKSLVHYDIANVLLTIIRQYLAGVQFKISAGNLSSIDPRMIERIFKNVNYLRNSEHTLNKQPVWTGNLYKTNYDRDDKKYGLIITPECDIAQGKFVNHKIIFGAEVNSQTLANYTVDDVAVPIIASKFSKKPSTGKWYPKSEIKEKIKKQNFIDHLFLLPFASENEHSILFDYRETGAIKPEIIRRWQMILRVNDPLIIEIMDNYSNLYNRKGLITYPYDNMNLIAADV